MIPDDNMTEAASLHPNKPPHLSNDQSNRLDTFKALTPTPESAARPTPTPEKRRKKTKISQEVTKDSEPKHASGDSLEDQDGTNGPKEESKIQLHDSSVTTVRQRYRTSNTRVSDPIAAQDDHSIYNERAFGRPKEGSLLSDIAKDGHRTTKTAPRPQKVLYPIWKWFLLGYVIWLAITYLVVSIYRFVATTLAPVCYIPFIRPQIPLCTEPSEAKDRPINASKVATSQQVLTIVMDRVGQNFDLARDMIGHDYAVRDLRIRLAASNLSPKQELTQELTSLIRDTEDTAKVGKSIDTVRTFDEHAVKALEGIAERQRNRPALPGQIISAISPFAAFDLAKNADSTEEQVKHLLITTATRISDRVKPLIDDSFNLAHKLDIIQATLDRIKELATGEIGGLPRTEVLGALWTRLARADDYEQYGSHTSLLTEMTGFYEISSDVVKETIIALNRVEAELRDLRNDYASPGLILKENPLEVIITLLRTSGQRLEAGKRKLEHIEKGERPQRNDIPNESTTTVTAT